MRLVLADDHPIVRTGISHLLAEQVDMEVVAETGDGLEALELVERHRPDVLILDLMLPGLSGLEVARRMRGSFPETRVLVLTLHANESYAAQVLADGAAGFVIKDAHPSEILRALRAVAAGRRHFPARLAEAPGSAVAEDPWSALTDREKEVAQLVAEGLSHADVGARLGISGRTVEVHRGNVVRKLRVSGTPELVRFLMRRGILSTDD
jgi:DNA-binding NarL/FixJ family response regulator